MNKKIFVATGIGVVILMYLCNVNYAVDNYGIVENSLTVNILAQDSVGGGGSGGSGGSGGGSEDNGEEEELNGCMSDVLGGGLIVIKGVTYHWVDYGCKKFKIGEGCIDGLIYQIGDEIDEDLSDYESFTCAEKYPAPIIA